LFPHLCYLIVDIIIIATTTSVDKDDDDDDDDDNDNRNENRNIQKNVQFWIDSDMFNTEIEKYLSDY